MIEQAWDKIDKRCWYALWMTRHLLRTVQGHCVAWAGLDHMCAWAPAPVTTTINQSAQYNMYKQYILQNYISCLHIEAFVVDKKCSKYPPFAMLWSLRSPWDDDAEDDKKEEDGSHLFEHLPLYFMSDSTHVEQNFSAQDFSHQTNKRSCVIFVPTYLVLVTFVWWKGQEPGRRKRMSIATAVGGEKRWNVKKVKGEKEALRATIFYEGCRVN